MVITLYELIGMKRKNSVLKSVFINKSKDSWSRCHINVEAYDDTFLNNTDTVSKQNKTYEYITKTIVENQEKIKEYIGDHSSQIDIMHYSTFDRHYQQLLLFNQ